MSKYLPAQESLHAINRVKDIGIIIIVAVIFLAIIIGTTMKTPNQEYLSPIEKHGSDLRYFSFHGEKEIFDFVLFFAVGMSGVSLGVVFLIVGAIINRQNAILRVLIHESKRRIMRRKYPPL